MAELKLPEVDSVSAPFGLQAIASELQVLSEQAEEESLPDKLTKTRTSIFGRIKSLFSSSSKINPVDLDQLEEILISADVGVSTTLKLLDGARSLAKEGRSFEELAKYVRTEIRSILQHQSQDECPINCEGENLKVILLIGVNGAGKTTSVAKLAGQWQSQGRKIVMAAGDTFRAAAVEQLLEWGNRLNIPVVRGADQAKPGTVVFAAIDEAQKSSADLLIIDTAGRLHNKANLMQELEGINNVIQKKLGRPADETILVLDGASGQNALQQAKEFNQIIPLTGIIITKLDGTPKGGIVIAIKSELNIPIRYIGVGEKVQDLRVFNASEFAEAIFS